MIYQMIKFNYSELNFQIWNTKSKIVLLNKNKLILKTKFLTVYLTEKP